MSTLYELLEKGKRLREKKAQADLERQKKEEEKMSRPMPFWNAFKWRGGGITMIGLGISLLFVALLISFTGLFGEIRIPGLENSRHILILVPAGTGILLILIAFQMAWVGYAKVKNWISLLPFPPPERYLRFLGTKFSSSSKYSGTIFFEIGIRIRFDDPVNAELLANAATGITGWAFKAEAEDDPEAYKPAVEENEEKEKEQERKESGEITFGSGEAEVMFEIVDDAEENTSGSGERTESTLIKLTGERFRSGMQFHTFFSRFCAEVLIPLHRESTIKKIGLYNENDPDFMDYL
jgi:hypothetical protein